MASNDEYQQRQFFERSGQILITSHESFGSVTIVYHPLFDLDIEEYKNNPNYKITYI